MKKLVIFGGTFDPIHNAHLRVATFAAKKLKAKVIFLPAKHPRWKAPHASIVDRYNMIKIALKSTNNPNLSISDYEIKQDAKINYTIDTLKYFKKKYKSYDLYLLIGADQVDSFDKWMKAEEIAKISKIVYVNRPEIKINQKIVKRFKMISLIYDKSGVASSHSIRHLTGLDTPYPVIKYIEKNNLYYIKTLKDHYYKEKRFNHALSVANLSYQIAIGNHLKNPDLYYIAGLLHDIGKKVSGGEQAKIMQKYYKKYYQDIPEPLYHQFVGAYLAETQLGISDKNILEAIMYHASGKANMSMMGKVIYASDKIDPLRGFDSTSLVRACVNNIERGYARVLRANYDYLVKHHRSVDNSLTKSCMKFYLKK